MVPVVGGPVKFVVAIAFVHRVLRLVPGGIDECERLAHGRLLPVCRTFPKGWLPGLRSGIDGENRQRRQFQGPQETCEESLDGATTLRPEGSISVHRPQSRE